jgi:hypothetical protein
VNEKSNGQKFFVKPAVRAQLQLVFYSQSVEHKFAAQVRENENGIAYAQIIMRQTLHETFYPSKTAVAAA